MISKTKMGCPQSKSPVVSWQDILSVVFVQFRNLEISLITSSNINEVIRAVLNSLLFFFAKRFYTHTHTHKVLTAYVSLVHICKRIVWSEDFTSYVLSVNVRTLKIIINLIKHKNAYKWTTSKRIKVTYFALAYINI